MSSQPRRLHAAAAATVEDLRRAYYDSANTPPNNWITEIQLDPPQLIVCDEQPGQTFRVPVTVGSDGGFAFGAAVPVSVQYVDSPGGQVAASGFRRASAADERRISAAVARGAVLPHSADHWRARAARGEDVSVLDRLASAVVPQAPAVAAAEARAAGLDDGEMVYEHFYGPLKRPHEDGALDPYRHLFPAASMDEVHARGAAADRAARRAMQQPMTDDELYDALWPEDGR